MAHVPLCERSTDITVRKIVLSLILFCKIPRELENSLICYSDQFVFASEHSRDLSEKSALLLLTVFF